MFEYQCRVCQRDMMTMMMILGPGESNELSNQSVGERRLGDISCEREHRPAEDVRVIIKVDY